jgi:hypothetical protein
MEENLIRANIYERYAIKWETNHPGHRAHTQTQRYERVNNMAYCYYMMCRSGHIACNAQGEWDSWIEKQSYCHITVPTCIVENEQQFNNRSVLDRQLTDVQRNGIT